MNARAGVRRPYVRSMQGWWRRDPFFMAYMFREATAFAVAIYAVVLAVGVMRLSQGEAAWNGWLGALRSPGSILLHIVLLVSFAVHARSWFEIMPKTMPMMFVGGHRVEGSTITRTGWYATVIVSVVMFALTWWWKK
jgi:fumarate reductase subunit C